MGLFKEVKCGRCDRRYPSIRSRCPFCGARKNRAAKQTGGGDNKPWQLIVGIIILLAVIIAVIVLVSSSLKNRDKKETDPTPSSQTGNDNIEDGISEVETSPTPTAPPATPTPTPAPTPTPTPTVNSITLNREDFTLSYIGEQFKMEATLSPAASGAEVTWYSEDETVAIVNSAGVVTAIDRGKTNIVAMAGGATKSCIVRVTADSVQSPGPGNNDDDETPTGLSISHTDVTIKAATSESFKLSVKGATGTVTFSTSNASVATVSDTGTVTAVAAGDCTVTATVDGTTLSCIVRVR
ncbi:MAG: hypothetical protein GXY20_05095 [Clostridiales bacterium]|nr:hypothetical protein [Clostridiales bacterium]